MNRHTTSLFFRLLRLGLETEKADVNTSLGFCALNGKSVDWQRIYALSIRQGVASILWDGLQHIKDEQTPPREVLMKLCAHTLSVETHNAKQTEVINKLAKFYASHDIRMMLLKGYGLSLLYPRPEHRPCGDIDIWLYGEQERADKLLNTEKGVAIDYRHHHHTVFHIRGIMVENHYNFFNVYAHLSNREIERELQQLAKQEDKAITVKGTTVYLPSMEFNALFLLRHAGAHFATAEIALRHIMDWVVFVLRHGKEMDWARLETTARKHNMYRFLHCLNGICIDWFGVPTECFPTFEHDKALERRVMEDILYPPFADKTALNGNLLQNIHYRLRRWWGQRWKYKLVFRENMVVTFGVLLRSHFIKPKAY